MTRVPETTVRKGHERRPILPVLALCLLCLMSPVAVHAFWPFGGSGGDGGSGLDLNRGYDVNTVTTVKGKVVSVNAEQGDGPALIAINTAHGAVFIVAGPPWFWRDNGIPVQIGDELTAHGSLTEGKDGRKYLLAQNLANQRTGAEVLLRGDDGAPVWTPAKRSSEQNRSPNITPGPKPGGRAGAGPRGRR